MRQTFLSHFCICLALCAAGWIAQIEGVFATIWANDQSLMTSVIAVVFVGSAIYLGWLAWRVDDCNRDGLSPDFGHWIERACVMLGLLGTTLGLSLQAKSLAASGSASFGALSTSLYTTGTGIAAALLIGLMTFNLERGIARSRS